MIDRGLITRGYPGPWIADFSLGQQRNSEKVYGNHSTLIVHNVAFSGLRLAAFGIPNTERRSIIPHFLSAVYVVSDNGISRILLLTTYS